MAHVINLTLPLYPYAPISTVWAYDVPFQAEAIREWKHGGAQLEYYQFHTETGTRLLAGARHNPEGPRLGDIDFADIVNREAIVLDIPKNANQEITASDIETCVEREPSFNRGQALLIRTTWGDGEKYAALGEDYVLQSPHFSASGAERLAHVMRDKGSNLLAIDTAFLAGGGRSHMIKEWTSLEPWHRPHWPSREAQTYLRYYSKEKERADWGAGRPLYESGLVVLGLCNTGAIATRYVLLTALPLFVEDSPGAPATVIAKPLFK